MSNGNIIPHDLAARRIQDALRLRVGRGKRYTFQGLSDATGVPTRTLESYVQGATPGLAAFLSLCAVLGPTFTSDVLADTGQAAHEANADDPEHLRALAGLCNVAAMISDAVADGKVDHRERAQLRPVVAELLQVLEPLTRDSAENVVAAPGRAS